jgi:ferric-chelate reductase
MLIDINLIAIFFVLLNSVLGSDTVIKSTLGYNNGAAEFQSCDTPISEWVWDYEPLNLGLSSDDYDAICGYSPAIGSILLCSTELADDKSDSYKTKIFKYASSVCKTYSSYSYQWTFYRDQYLNATKYYTPFENVGNTSTPFYVPTTPNITDITPEYKSYQGYYFILDTGTWFAVGICGYFLLLIIISAIYNFARYTTIAKSINSSSFSKFCQKFIIFPTLFPNARFSHFYGWKYCSVLIPKRIQFLTDLFLFALQVAFYAVNYNYQKGWWFGTGDDDLAWSKNLADRTGIMAFGKIPLLILFAGRNNFLLWITGWSYSTFLHYHKVIAFWLFMDALIHGIARAADIPGVDIDVLDGDYETYGVLALIFLGVIIGTTFRPIRVLYYEYFLTLHTVLAVVFIAMCWFHCKDLGWLEWLIAASCVWFFDRLVRVIRMFSFGWRTATITVAGANLMKVEVPKPSWWLHRPGTYSYIYFAGWIFWENHPFTTVVEGNNLCAYISVKKGVTYRVWNKLLANDNKLKWKISIEGPYGGESAYPLKKYDECLLIAGGSGVPGMLENAANISKGTLIWITPTVAHVRAYEPLIRNIHTDLDIYITREEGVVKNCSFQDLFQNVGDSNDYYEDSNSENIVADSSEESDFEKIIHSYKDGVATVNYNRPDIKELINSSIENSTSKSVGIMACGPPKLMDEIRNSIASNVTSWDKSVDFFDEFQIW